MADLSKIKLNGTVYNLKDAQLREELENNNFITENDLNDYMIKGVDYVTAGQLSGITPGTGATAEGVNTLAVGDYSHAEGYYSVATAASSHVEGDQLIAAITLTPLRPPPQGTVFLYSILQGDNYHLSKYETQTDKIGFLVLDYDVLNETGEEIFTSLDLTIDSMDCTDCTMTFSNENAIILYTYTSSTLIVYVKNGAASHTEGKNTLAAGSYSHAEGRYSQAIGVASHAEGSNTIASGYGSHTEGHHATASGSYSHAEGHGTVASNTSSHAEGASTTASSDSSHAEGYMTAASGFASHAEGEQTTASSDSSHAEGTNTTASGNSTHAEGDNTLANGTDSHAEGYKTIALSNYTHVEGYGIRGNNTLKLTGVADATTYTYSNPGNVGSILVGRIIYIPRLQIAKKITAVDTDNTSITLSSTFGEALNNEDAELRGGASGNYSHSEGYFSTASGVASHSEGAYNIASGDWAHAEGYTTRASGDYSHAEGYTSEATNTYAHVEGNDNIASGNASHVEGAHNIASGTLAHAEGFWTLGSSRMNHVFGQANIEDTNTSGTGGAHAPTKIGTYIEIVGNGTVNSSGTVTKRSNARTLDWDGNEVLAGKLTIGAAPTANMDVATKKYVDDGLGAKQATITAGTYLQFGTGTSAATLSHKNSGVTAGTSGSSTDYSGTSFAVPWFTVDAQGHVTARGTRNITVSGLGVAAGGTGVSSFTANSVIMSGSSTTAALTTRAITNNTSATAVTASTNLITANTLYYHKGNSNIVTVGTITSGTWHGATIGVGYGGTGLTASPSMTVNLASTSAANVFQASPQPGVTGTLPVSNGGTGRTTMSYANAVLIGNASTVTNAMQAIRTASGAFYATDQDAKPAFGTLPVAQGGTGATAAAAARTNLNVPPSPRSNLIGTSFIPPVTNVGNWVTSYITATLGADYTTIQVSDATHNGLYYLTTGVTITSSSYKNKTYYLRLRWATPSSNSLTNNKDLQFKSTVVNNVCVLQSLDGATTLQPGSTGGIWSDSNATYGLRVGVGLAADSKIKVIVRIDAGFNYTKDSSGNSTTTENKIKLGAIKLEIGADQTLVDGNNNLYGNINYQTGLLAVRKGGTGRNTMSYKNAVPIGNATTVTDAMQVVRTASGAFYATAQDAAPSFGTLPVAQGGTGLTSLPTGVLMYNSGITNDLPAAPTNLNNITATGFYKFSSSTHTTGSTNNGPWSSTTYDGYTAVLLHIAYSSNNHAQLAFKTGTSGATFYKRACYNGTWTSWAGV